MSKGNSPAEQTRSSLSELPVQQESVSISANIVSVSASPSENPEKKNPENNGYNLKRLSWDMVVKENENVWDEAQPQKPWEGLPGWVARCFTLTHWRARRP